MQSYRRGKARGIVAFFPFLLALVACEQKPLKLPSSDNTSPRISVTVTELSASKRGKGGVATGQVWQFDDFCCDQKGMMHMGDYYAVAASGEDDDGGVQRVEIWAGVDKVCCAGTNGVGSCRQGLFGAPTAFTEDMVPRKPGDDVFKERDLLYIFDPGDPLKLCPNGTLTSIGAIFSARAQNYYNLRAISKELTLTGP